MIAFLKGKPLKRTIDYIILDVNGVGYKIFTPLSTLCNIKEGELTQLFIETIFREDSISLFGFSTESEKNVFNKLLTVSKVGPKLAVAILSGLSVDKLINAVNSKNLKLLTSVPGVGKKTAERICFDLKDSFSKESVPVDNALSDADIGYVEDDIVMALTNLGYKANEVRGIASRTVKKYPDETLENLLKIILNDLYNG